MTFCREAIGNPICQINCKINGKGIAPEALETAWLRRGWGGEMA